MKFRVLLVILVLSLSHFVYAQPEIDLNNTYTFENGVEIQYPDGWEIVEVQDGVTGFAKPSIQLIFITSPFLVADERVPLVDPLLSGINIAEAPVPAFEDLIYFDWDDRFPLIYQYSRDEVTQGIISTIRMSDGSIGLLDVVFREGVNQQHLDEMTAMFDSFDLPVTEGEPAIRYTYEQEYAMNANWFGTQQNFQDNIGNALEFFSLAIESDPEVALYYNNRASTLSALERYEEAIEDATRAIELESTSDSAYFNRAFAYAGLLEYELAILDLTEAIRLNPEDALYYSDRGAIKRRSGDFEGAIEDYNQAIELEPDNPDTYLIRALALAFLEDFEAASADYERVLELDPDYEQTIHLIHHYVDGDLERAINAYTNNLSTEPEFPLLYFHRGNAYRHNGDDDLAISDLNTYLELAGDDADPRALEWLEELGS